MISGKTVSKELINNLQKILDKTKKIKDKLETNSSPNKKTKEHENKISAKIFFEVVYDHLETALILLKNNKIYQAFIIIRSAYEANIYLLLLKKYPKYYLFKELDAFKFKLALYNSAQANPQSSIGKELLKLKDLEENRKLSLNIEYF